MQRRKGKGVTKSLAVSSIPELPRLLDLDKSFWNVVSIREPTVSKPECLRNARRYLEVFFEDREDLPDFPSRQPRSEDVAVMFEFVDAHPGERTAFVDHPPLLENRVRLSQEASRRARGLV